MNRAVTICLLAGLAIGIERGAQGATIDAGNHSLLPNRSGQSVVVTIVGGESIAGLDFFAQVGDGGPELTLVGLPPGTVAPAMTLVDLQSGIFLGNASGQTDLLTSFGGSLPQLAAYGVFTHSGSVAADGILAILQVDTTGFTTGSWPLALTTLAGVTALYDFEGAAVDAILLEGSLTIVPEPSGLVLALWGVSALVLRACVSRRALRRPALGNS